MLTRTRIILALAILIALTAFPGVARGYSYVVQTQLMGLTDNQVTWVETDHWACGQHWRVAQEVHWGAITETWAYIRHITFHYWVFDGGYVHGGRAAAYNSSGYVNDSGADSWVGYTWYSPSNPYAGNWTLSVEHRFDGGQSNNPYFLVWVDKHTQAGGYLTGEECHGKYTVGYHYAPPGGGCGGAPYECMRPE